ncbi:UNVERIFIED_CONTAM: hypothetical protein FKN15_073335 [Acipenser sinensis]
MTSSQRARLAQLRQEAVLSLISGSAHDIRPTVEEMVAMPLPLSEKYQEIDAESIVRENTANKPQPMDVLPAVSTALNILEKYGRNLVNPSKPKYWRTVNVLLLYGYSEQQKDGLSFPDAVQSPEADKVAGVTLEVMMLRVELEMLSKGGRSVLLLYGYSEQQKDGLSFPDAVQSPEADKVAGVTLEVMMLRVELEMLSKDFGGLISDCVPFVGEKGGAGIPQPVTPNPVATVSASPETCTMCGISAVSTHCPSCVQSLCSECDGRFHMHPGRAWHKRTPVALPRNPRIPGSPSVLCQACERPRLAARPSLPAIFPLPAPGLTPTTSLEKTATQLNWICSHCTFVNTNPGRICDMCDRTSQHPDPSHAPPLPRPQGDVPVQATQQPRPLLEPKETPPQPLLLPPSKATPPGKKDTPLAAQAASLSSQDEADWSRQEELREEGLKLVKMIREAESSGFSPEQVFAAVHYSGTTEPCDWLRSELPLVLDALTELATSDLQGARLSRQEAITAWEGAGGDLERAVKDAKVLRRLLAVYELASWGRAELVLSLMLEQGGATYCLEDVVQAVRESADRDFIKRMLSTECAVCYAEFPQNRLRECLDEEVYQLFHKKLTEIALMKDPKFLWCSHSSGSWHGQSSVNHGMGRAL